MSDLIFPNTFVRQYSGPLDKDIVFTTTVSRTNYLTNPRRYPGQMVYDTEAKKAFVLNNDASAWEDIYGANVTITGELTGTIATFTTSISSPLIKGNFYGDGSNLTGVVKDASAYAPLSGAAFIGSVTGIDSTFTTYISSPSIYGNFYGDGSGLTGLDTNGYAPLSGSTFTGAITGTEATFTTSISAPSIYGKFYGDGNSLTLNTSVYAPLSGSTFTGAITGTEATFTTSISAPLIYGDGSNITGITLGQIGVVSGSVLNQFVGNGSTTTYPISGYNGVDKGGYLVSVGGIDQPASYWTISSVNGGQITFVESPKTGEVISVRAILGNLYQTVFSYNTVTIGYGLKVFSVRPNTSMIEVGMNITAYASNGNWMSGYVQGVTSSGFTLSVNSIKGTIGSSASYWIIRVGFALNLDTKVPSSGDLMIYDGTKWSSGTAISTSTNATQLQNVDIDNSPPTNGDVLQYNGETGMWVSGIVPAADADAISIQGIAVNAPSPNDGQVLKYSVDQGKWIAGEDLNSVDIGGKAWNTNISYVAGDIVTTSSTDPAWICTAANTGENPTSPSSPVFWSSIKSDTVQLQSKNVSSTAPTVDGQALIWNNTANQWEPGTATASANATQLQGTAITDPLQPQENQILQWSYLTEGGGNLEWRAKNLPGPELSVSGSVPASDGGLSTAAVTVAGWLQVTIGSTIYKMPYFQ